MVQWTLIKPPRSRIGPVTKKERAIIKSISPVEGKYDEEVDRESAEEVLLAKATDAVETAKEVKVKGKEEVAKQPRKTKSMWEKAFRRGAKDAADQAHAQSVIGSKDMLRNKGWNRNGCRCRARQEISRQSDALGCDFSGRFDRDRFGWTCRWPFCAQFDRWLDALIARAAR